MRKVLIGLFCLITGFVFVLTLHSAEESKNLLQNGDFSMELNGSPVAWKRGGGHCSKEEGSTMEIVYDEEMPFAEGFRVLKITQYFPKDAKGPYRFVNREYFPIEHGKKYKFSFWMRADSPLSMSFAFDGGSSELHKKLGADYRHWWKETHAEISEQWKEYSAVIKIPGPNDDGYCAEMKKVWTWMDFENGTYWIARASVVEVDTIW